MSAIDTGVMAHQIVSTTAIRDDVFEMKSSDSLFIAHFKTVGTKHFLHDVHPVNDVFHYLTLVLFIPLTVLVNVLVLLTVGLIERLHTPHDVMLAISSLMDLLVGLMFLPVDIYLHEFDTFVGSTRASCFLVYFSAVPFSLSLTAYVLMSTERWTGVMYPFWYQKNVTTCKVVAIAVLVICTEIILEAVLMIVYMKFDDKLPLSDRCDVHKTFPDWFVTTLQSIIISTKLLISLVLCIHVNIIARRHRRFIKRHSRPVYLSSQSVPFMERQSIVPIVCTFLFIILWGPKLIFDNLHVSKTVLAYFRIFDLVLESLLVSNSFINPLLICSIKPLYRKSFKAILLTPPWKLRDLQERLRVVANENSFKCNRISNVSPIKLRTMSSSDLSTDIREVVLEVSSDGSMHMRQVSLKDDNNTPQRRSDVETKFNTDQDLISQQPSFAKVNASSTSQHFLTKKSTSIFSHHTKQNGTKFSVDTKKKWSN